MEGEYDLGDVKISCFNSYNDDMNGLKRGITRIFIIEVDNITICNLGLIGFIPGPEIIDMIGKIDVLCIPVGGNYTIDYHDANKLCTLINPKIVIPMNYKTLKDNIALDGVDKFISSIKNIEKLKCDKLTLNYPLDSNSKIVLLNRIN
jgi:L-ascorbate metabolism protein UlaG (beta-lactamase superfamily)